MYKVLLTTSGIGSRLKEKTKDTNKALVLVNGKSTISYILELYDTKIPIVVTLGYLGEQVKEYLLENHSERVFEFAEVDHYEGEGSSLLYSMRCAKEYLQCPFIFHACDTILVEPIPAPEYDWVAGYVVDPKEIEIAQYRSHKIKDGYLEELQDRGAKTCDSIHIGMDGFHSHELFWRAVEELYKENPNDSSLCDTQIIERMVDLGANFKWLPYKVWLDTGNVSALELTEAYLERKKL